MVAALYVSASGAYASLPGVDPWDEARDARQYAGPHPVVAHPPCQRWGKLWAGQPLHIKRTGQRKIKGDDDGCFAAALAAVRRWGGILEHPWGSHAWPHFGIPVPPRSGGWISTGIMDGGWTCCVEQGRYGHYARKPTLLLVYGCDLPQLDWGIGEPRLDPAVIARMGLARAKRLGEVGARGGGTDSAPRIGTPPAFRDLLLSIARTAQPQRKAALPATPTPGAALASAPDGGEVWSDLPDRFEAWWQRYSHGGQESAQYSRKKRIAFDAFCAALATLVSDSADQGGVVSRATADALNAHTSHGLGCAIYQQSWVSGVPRCTCGLDDARAALQSEGKG